MGIKVVAGGIIEKDGKFLLVKEKQKICEGKWNIPAGAVDEEETVIEAAKREIFEETGCNVKINGILEIVNKHMENIDLVCFFFNTELIDENIKYDGVEITDIKWFSYEEMLQMKSDLRADGYFLTTIKNKVEGRITSLEVLNTDM